MGDPRALRHTHYAFLTPKAGCDKLFKASSLLSMFNHRHIHEIFMSVDNWPGRGHLQLTSRRLGSVGSRSWRNEVAQLQQRRGEAVINKACCIPQPTPANVNSCGQRRAPAAAHLVRRLDGMLTVQPSRRERPCCGWGFHQSPQVPLNF